MGWEEVAGQKSEKEKIPYTKFENGSTMIRVLDNEPYSFWSHWLNKQQTSVTCLTKDCPICSIIAQMKANKETPIYTSTMRHAIRIWNYTTNQMEIMIQGKVFFSQLLTLHKEVGDITSYDIKVVRKGSGTDTTYTLLPSAPTDFKITDGITNVDMANLFSPPTREEMLMLIEGKTWAEINGVDAA
jgi:hypothetical protein